MQKDSYIVIRFDWTWKLWVPIFVVFLVMLIGSNYRIQQWKEYNQIAVGLLSNEVQRLHYDLERCRRTYKNAEHRRQELLDLWAGKDELTYRAYNQREVEE